jgi:hypothetical protein
MPKNIFFQKRKYTESKQLEPENICHAYHVKLSLDSSCPIRKLEEESY